MTTNGANVGAPPQPTTKEAMLAYVDALTLAEPFQAKLWQEAQVTLTQLAVLRELRSGRQSAGRLGDRVGLSPTSMTRLVDRLESRGLVSRHRQAHDRRLVEIQLEPAGETLLGATRVFKGTPLHLAMEAMSGDQREKLVASLHELVEIARTFSKQEKPD